MGNLGSKKTTSVLCLLLGCWAVGLVTRSVYGGPIPAGTSTTTVSYRTTSGDVSYSVVTDYLARNITDAVSLVGAPNIWSFNSINSFGRRSMLAQRGFSVLDPAVESSIATAFFKGTNGDDYFPDIEVGSEITILISGITFDQPVYVDESTLMLHALWKAEQADLLADPYFHLDNHHTMIGLFRDFDEFIAGGFFANQPVPTYVIPEDELAVVISGSGTRVIDIELRFPYSVLTNLEETGQFVPGNLPAPHGFLEPFHFHIEYVVTSDVETLQLPPMPVPAENPITESKRILGKILFWEEQISSNDSVACGTCHRYAFGSSDPRLGRNPGVDGVFNTLDDVVGSFGIPIADADNVPYQHPVFGWDPQVTGRTAPMMIGSQYAPELFWDGRAGSTFLNPDDGTVSIVSGGALENQALGPIMSDAEMSHESRGWDSVTSKLATAEPLALATDFPPDVAAALTAGITYPDLFAAAFGDSAITAERIGFAIATYERTLYPGQTPWDRFMAGEAEALTADQIEGWEFFQNSECIACHVPPLFTDHSYRNIGLRPVVEDSGRQQFTGAVEDRGKFRVPTLRNVGLKAKFMHHGLIRRLQDVVAYYMGLYTMQFMDNIDPLIPGIDVPLPKLGPLLDFLENGLTDPRVANQTFPFDCPTLKSQRVSDPPALVACFTGPGGVANPAEECVDLFDADGDGDVDLLDYQSLLWALPGR